MAETAAEKRSRFELATSPHLDAVFRVALRMTGSVDRAEDAVQETFLRAWKYFDTFTEGRDAKVWLFAILRNAVFEAGRKKRRELKAASLDEIGADVAEGRPQDPAARLREQEVLDALDKLPEPLRLVALLAIVEEFAYREIADALEIPIGTVMSRLFRARQLLRYHLKGYVGDEVPEAEAS